MAVVQGEIRDTGLGTSVRFRTTRDGSNDDTQAIRDAITAAPANGGTVYFPPGTYKGTGTINVTNKPIQFLGAGPRQTIILRVHADFRTMLNVYNLM